MSKIKSVISQPSLVFVGIQKGLFRVRYGRGIDVIKQDWDNLIILDACRYDYFLEENSIEGNLKSAISKGSHSGEFTEKNFTDRDLHDTVYVTANPNISRIDKDTFFTVENCLTLWDEEKGTVLPEDMVDAALRAHENYPNKRLIVHFMQPHTPYLGPTAAEIDDKLENNGYGGVADTDIVELNNDSVRSHWGGNDVWVALKEGSLSKEEVRKAYRESLNIVLVYAEDLVNELCGKSVITADHGEYLGERRFPYLERKIGHPWEFTPELRVVPWLEVEDETRRKIEAEEPIGFERLEETVIQERLRDFGYLPE